MRKKLIFDKLYDAASFQKRFAIAVSASDAAADASDAIKHNISLFTLKRSSWKYERKRHREKSKGVLGVYTMPW